MADTKISALPASTTPLAGTEVLPIVQGGVTRQVSVANLTAGRAISATQLTLSTGNLIVASGQGIDFSATPGTGTSELLADYEEGTWTPTAKPFSGSITTVGAVAGSYTKIGRQVTVSCTVAITNNGTGTVVLLVQGLPFVQSTANVAFYAGCGENRSNGKSLSVELGFEGGTSTPTLFVYLYDATYPVASGQTLVMTCSYNV
jgi:hypothetical protein